MPHEIFENLSFMWITIQCHPASNVGGENDGANRGKTKELEMTMDWRKVVYS